MTTRASDARLVEAAVAWRSEQQRLAQAGAMHEYQPSHRPEDTRGCRYCGKAPLAGKHEGTK